MISAVQVCAFLWDLATALLATCVEALDRCAVQSSASQFSGQLEYAFPCATLCPRFMLAHVGERPEAVRLQLEDVVVVVEGSGPERRIGGCEPGEWQYRFSV